MIQISLTNAIFVYGAVMVVVFVLLYTTSELRARNVYRVLEKQFLWRCSYCGFLYLDEDSLALSQCPRCESFNAHADAQDRLVSASRERIVALEPETIQSDDEQAPRRNPARRKRTHQTRRGPRRRR